MPSCPVHMPCASAHDEGLLKLLASLIGAVQVPVREQLLHYLHARNIASLLCKMQAWFIIVFKCT